MGARNAHTHLPSLGLMSKITYSLTRLYCSVRIAKFAGLARKVLRKGNFPLTVILFSNYLINSPLFLTLTLIQLEFSSIAFSQVGAYPLRSALNGAPHITQYRTRTYKNAEPKSAAYSNSANWAIKKAP